MMEHCVICNGKCNDPDDHFNRVVRLDDASLAAIRQIVREELDKRL